MTFRNDSFPALAIDGSSGALYVVWADYRSGNADILISRSRDGGDAWSAPARINADACGLLPRLPLETVVGAAGNCCALDNGMKG